VFEALALGQLLGQAGRRRLCLLLRDSRGRFESLLARQRRKALGFP